MTEFLISKLVPLLYALPCVLIAIPVHEVAHGYVANRCGDPTAKSFGRLTLNPLKHFDPLGALCMLLVGFGWARPVPVNSRYFKKPRRDMFLVALAGPLANLLLSLAALLLYRILGAVFLANYTAFETGAFTTTLLYVFMQFLSVFISMNVSFAVFNLLPIPPLDGSRLLLIFLPPKAHIWFVRNERTISLVMFLLLIFNVLDLPLVFLRNLVLNGMDALVSLIPFL